MIERCTKYVIYKEEGSIDNAYNDNHDNQDFENFVIIYKKNHKNKKTFMDAFFNL